MTTVKGELELIKYCKTNCNKNATIQHILNDTEKCNFCDLPYIILEIQEKEKYNDTEYE